MKENKKVIVLVSALLVTVIVIVGSIVTVTKIHKGQENQPNTFSPVIEQVLSDEESVKHEIKLEDYNFLVENVEQPEIQADQIIDTNEETGEVLYITESGAAASTEILPPEDAKDYGITSDMSEADILAALDNIWNEVNSQTDSDEDTEGNGDNTQEIIDNNISNSNTNNNQQNNQPQNNPSTNNSSAEVDSEDNSEEPNYPEYAQDWDWNLPTEEDQEGSFTVGDDINSDVSFNFGG